MRNILIILALFVCASICLGQTGQTITVDHDIGGVYPDIAGNGDAYIENLGKARLMVGRIQTAIV